MQIQIISHFIKFKLKTTMNQPEKQFDYIKIKLASPNRIKEWGQRTLPNGQIIGEVKKS
jgi:hypothetical protein